MRYVWRSWSGRIGAVLVGGVVLAALVSLVWTPYDPKKVDPGNRWQPISWDHWFGTDGGGKDLFTQVLVGARTTLLVAAGSVLIAAVIGLTLGVLSAISPRWAGEGLAHLIDVLISLPTLILALVLVAALEGSIWTVSLAVGIGFGVVLARVVRGEVARVCTNDYILAAGASGSSTWRTVWRHILPNIAPTVIVQLSLFAGLAVLAEAALSYLGSDTRRHAVMGPDAGRAAAVGHRASRRDRLSRSRRRAGDARVQPPWRRPARGGRSAAARSIGDGVTHVHEHRQHRPGGHRWTGGLDGRPADRPG